ncbi:unnamed protein product, partial [Rotaria sp. Silwood2]
MRNTIEYSKSYKASRQFNEIRNVPESHYVCQWWIQQFQGIVIENNANTSIQFKKKHRDQIRWNNALLPFRRSGLWMTIKVVLHTILAKNLGNAGTVVYKLLITHFLVEVIVKTYRTIRIDLLVHCIRKIVRRINKIENLLLSIKSNNVSKWVQCRKHEIQMKINQILPNSDWQNSIKSDEEKKNQLLMNNFKLNDFDIYKHSYHGLKAYLNNQNLGQTFGVISGSNNRDEFSYVTSNDNMPSIKELTEKF